MLLAQRKDAWRWTWCKTQSMQSFAFYFGNLAKWLSEFFSSMANYKIKPLSVEFFFWTHLSGNFWKKNKNCKQKLKLNGLKNSDESFRSNTNIIFFVLRSPGFNFNFARERKKGCWLKMEIPLFRSCNLWWVYSLFPVDTCRRCFVFFRFSMMMMMRICGFNGLATNLK